MLDQLRLLLYSLAVMGVMFFITYLHDKHLKEYKTCMIKHDEVDECLGK